jgi:hypothetical protein
MRPFNGLHKEEQVHSYPKFEIYLGQEAEKYVELCGKKPVSVE